MIFWTGEQEYGRGFRNSAVLLFSCQDSLARRDGAASGARGGSRELSSLNGGAHGGES